MCEMSIAYGIARSKFSLAAHVNKPAQETEAVEIQRQDGKCANHSDSNAAKSERKRQQQEYTQQKNQQRCAAALSSPQVIRHIDSTPTDNVDERDQNHKQR